MQHYWGAKAILERVGFSPTSFSRFPQLKRDHQIPGFMRRKPKSFRTMYYASEAMIIGWEMAKSKQCHEQLCAELAAGVDRRYKCRERVKPTVAA
jgi:hypothetical protein